MRTAEEILKSKGRLRKMCPATKNSIRAAINEARKEAIEQCAERAEAWVYAEGNEPECGVDKQSILNLINELK